VQAELARSRYPVQVTLRTAADGWPIIAELERDDGQVVKLGEFEEFPLLEPSVDNLSEVITNLVRALVAEYLETGAYPGSPFPPPYRRPS
jgi:hypothetical protein